MIWFAAPLMIGMALAALLGGYFLARSEFDEALTRARWEANCWKKRCQQLELQDHVRIVNVQQRIQAPDSLSAEDFGRRVGIALSSRKERE